MAGANSVELLAGTVVNAMPDVAEKWIKQGVAMCDKSMDGGSETKKTKTVPPIKRRRKTRR